MSATKKKSLTFVVQMDLAPETRQLISVERMTAQLRLTAEAVAFAATAGTVPAVAVTCWNQPPRPPRKQKRSAR